MITTRPRLEILAVVMGLALGCFWLLIRAASDGILEMGDGVSHYMIARYAWKHPELFLDLWGKPLFTILAGPFAQVGHVGVAAFNAIVASATALIGIRALRRAGGAAQVVFPLLVLLSPQYVLMVIAGMTEPLFGLVTVLALVFLLDKRYLIAAVVASLSPLARPEYIVFLPCVMLWLVMERQWRALPWCFFGLALYSVLTTITKGEPLWFWTGDPYSYAGSVYGSGPLEFFVSRAELVYGWPLLTLGVCALVLWPLVYRHDRDGRREHRLMLLCAALPALGIVAVHSLLWYKGWRGSAGLLRVLVTSVPLAGLFTAYTLGRGAGQLLAHRRGAMLITGFLLPVLCFWIVYDLSSQVKLPIRPEKNQHFLDAAAYAVKNHRREGLKVYSTHPYMAFRSEIDPFDITKYHQLFRAKSGSALEGMRSGDLLIWDSQLGSNEAGLPLERILNDDRFTVLATFEPPEGTRVLGGHVYEIFLFERRGSIRSFTVDTLIWEGMVRDVPAMRVDTIQCAQPTKGQWCLKEGEFPLEIRDLPAPDAGSIYYELVVSGNVDVEEASRLTLVYTQHEDGQSVRYDQEDVLSGPFVFNRRVPPIGTGIEQKLYFWNIGGKPFTLDGFTVLRKRWTQRPA